MLFYLTLALRLGRSLQELLATVSSEELTLWRAYDTLQPIGDWRHDLGYGVIASTIANVNRGKNAEAFKPADFMPLQEKPELTLAQKIKEGLRKASLVGRAKKGGA